MRRAFRRVRVPANLLAVAVAVVALVVSATGVAVAVTSTVTISDPTTSTYVAHVDSGGHLRVATQPGLNQPFALGSYVPVGNGILSAPTSAALAITRFGLSNTSANTSYSNTSFEIFLVAITVGSNGNCYDSDATTTYLPVREVLPPGTNADADLSGNPVAYKPTGTKKWCLGTATTSAGGTPGSYYLPYASVTGYVTGGSFSPSPTVTGTTKDPLATPATPHPQP